jgi:hypothetical protein
MKTTKKQYDTFVNECVRLQKEWGLINWHIYFEHTDKVNGYADIGTCTNYVCTVRMAKSIDKEEVKHFDPIKSARHEMIHLILGRLSDLAKSRNYTSSDYFDAEEECVLRLMSIIFDQSYTV